MVRSASHRHAHHDVPDTACACCIAHAPPCTHESLDSRALPAEPAQSSTLSLSAPQGSGTAQRGPDQAQALVQKSAVSSHEQPACKDTASAEAASALQGQPQGGHPVPRRRSNNRAAGAAPASVQAVPAPAAAHAVPAQAAATGAPPTLMAHAAAAVLRAGAVATATPPAAAGHGAPAEQPAAAHTPLTAAAHQGLWPAAAPGLEHALPSRGGLLPGVGELLGGLDDEAPDGADEMADGEEEAEPQAGQGTVGAPGCGGTAIAAPGYAPKGDAAPGADAAAGPSGLAGPRPRKRAAPGDPAPSVLTTDAGAAGRAAAAAAAAAATSGLEVPEGDGEEPAQAAEPDGRVGAAQDGKGAAGAAAETGPQAAAPKKRRGRPPKPAQAAPAQPQPVEPSTCAGRVTRARAKAAAPAAPPAAAATATATQPAGLRADGPSGQQGAALGVEPGPVHQPQALTACAGPGPAAAMHPARACARAAAADQQEQDGAGGGDGEGGDDGQQAEMPAGDVGGAGAARAGESQAIQPSDLQARQVRLDSLIPCMVGHQRCPGVMWHHVTSTLTLDLSFT